MFRISYIRNTEEVYVPVIGNSPAYKVLEKMTIPSFDE
jgi:hypothetical protein